MTGEKRRENYRKLVLEGVICSLETHPGHKAIYGFLKDIESEKLAWEPFAARIEALKELALIGEILES